MKKKIGNKDVVTYKPSASNRIKRRTGIITEIFGQLDPYGHCSVFVGGEQQAKGKSVQRQK